MPEATPAIMRASTGPRNWPSPESPELPELPDQVGPAPALLRWLSWLSWPALSVASASMLDSDCDCVVFMSQACSALRARAIGKNPDSTPNPGVPDQGRSGWHHSGTGAMMDTWTTSPRPAPRTKPTANPTAPSHPLPPP